VGFLVKSTEILNAKTQNGHTGPFCVKANKICVFFTNWGDIPERFRVAND